MTCPGLRPRRDCLWWSDGHSCRRPAARAPRLCKATSMVPCCRGG